jgi:hypothetical protein
VTNQGIGVVKLAGGKIYDVPTSVNVGSNARIEGDLAMKSIVNYTGPNAATDTDFNGVFSLAAQTSWVTIANVNFTRRQPAGRGAGFGGLFGTDFAVKVVNPVHDVRVLSSRVTNFSGLFQSTNMIKWSNNIEISHCEAVENQAYFVHVIMTKKLRVHDNDIEQINVGNRWTHAGAMFRGVQDMKAANNRLNVKGVGAPSTDSFLNRFLRCPNCRARPARQISTQKLRAMKLTAPRKREF